MNEFNGFLLVDKPPLCTSFNIVSLCRKVFDTQRIGHSGTLDPFATGLLVIAVGEALKLLEYIPSEPKEYTGTAILGATSSTYDRDGEIVPFSTSDSVNKKIDLNLINKVIQQKFLGRIMQVPPAHSAIKVRGVPAYIRARRGEDLSLPARPSTIYEFEITDFSYPRLSFRCQVSSGTYIRSLLHDLGQELRVGAYLDTLRRTKIASFSVDQGVLVSELEQYLLDRSDHNFLSSRIVPLEFAVSHLPRKTLTLPQYERLVQGLYIDLDEDDHALFQNKNRVLPTFLDNRLVGVLEFTPTNQLKFHKKFNIPLS